VDGDCLRGVAGNAGDIGVMPVPASASRLPSAPQPAGQLDILLARASLNVLARHLRYSAETVETRADLEACVARRLPAVDEWINDCVEALAPARRSMLCVLGVPVVVLDAMWTPG
jgi:predicted NBD/HSP70 family sugar kinase